MEERECLLVESYCKRGVGVAQYSQVSRSRFSSDRPERVVRNREPLWCQRRGPILRTLRHVWRVAKYRVRHRVLRWLVLAYKWSTVFRIAYGHIEFERARDYAPNRIGRAFRVLPDQTLVPRERTEARSSGIRTLEATFGDWLSQLDRQIFLMGFEAGEEFVLRMGSTGYIESYLAPFRGGNSMPPAATQQPTERDLPNPLPSQE
jgi:hypothetical protein